MSKHTNDGLTRSGTGCFIAVPIWQQWASNGIYCIASKRARVESRENGWKVDVTGAVYRRLTPECILGSVVCDD